MRKLETKKGYYVNEDNSIVGKIIYLPDAVDVAAFRLVSEKEGVKLIEALRKAEEGRSDV